MAAPKALFIFNPFSGKGTIKNNLFDVVDSLVKEGYAVEVRPTQKKLDAYETVLEKGARKQLLVILGGDGILNVTV